MLDTVMQTNLFTGKIKFEMALACGVYGVLF